MDKFLVAEQGWSRSVLRCVFFVLYVFCWAGYRDGVDTFLVAYVGTGAKSGADAFLLSYMGAIAGSGAGWSGHDSCGVRRIWNRPPTWGLLDISLYGLVIVVHSYT